MASHTEMKSCLGNFLLLRHASYCPFLLQPHSMIDRCPQWYNYGSLYTCSRHVGVPFQVRRIFESRAYRSNHCWGRLLLWINVLFVELSNLCVDIHRGLHWARKKPEQQFFIQRVPFGPFRTRKRRYFEYFRVLSFSLIWRNLERTYYFVSSIDIIQRHVVSQGFRILIDLYSRLITNQK